MKVDSKIFGSPIYSSNDIYLIFTLFHLSKSRFDFSKTLPI